MHPHVPVCPDCHAPAQQTGELTRRALLRAAGGAAVAASLPAGAWGAPATRPAEAVAGPTARSAAETAVKALYDSLTEVQRKAVCFAWDHVDPNRGLLRTHVSNNWHVTKPSVRSEFFTTRQQGIIFDIFKGVFQPDWTKKITRQLKDDTSGAEWGAEQSIAIFGTPGEGKFEFVMTGRHLTIRADGNSESRVAFGGPIFHGHAATGDTEQIHHPDNVFWPQAVAANRVYQMLDGRQRERALVDGDLPREHEVPFRGRDGKAPGIEVGDLSQDQRAEIEKVLAVMLEPYRDEDRAEALACLKRQGGVEACRLAFYKDADLGNDQEWDNWRMEGPAFVWYFRGYPHVHLWINVADDPSVKLNARG